MPIINKPAYLRTNRAALGISIACLALPFVLLPFAAALPALAPRCACRSLTGLPCPVCGLTRGVYALLTGKWAHAQSLCRLSIPAVALLASEIIFRSLLILRTPGPDKLAVIARSDLRIHLVLLGAYLAYALLFWARVILSAA